MNLQALLALFARSAREDTRSKALLWARVGIAAAVLFAMFRSRVLFAVGGAPGLAFFGTVVWMNFMFICIAGVSYFASPITEEKEEGTLGLLRMTDLSPVAILLGKSTSRLLGGFLLLLVQVPFVMLAITLGGVRLDQVYGCYALLASFLFFACNVGLLGSVWSWRTGVASVVAFLIAFAYMVSPALLDDVLPGTHQTLEELARAFRTPAILDEILDNRSAAVPVGRAVLALLAGGIAAFAASWLLFERFCGDEAVLSRTAAGPITSAAGSPFGRPSRAWSDAICWRDYHYLHGGPRIAALKAVFYFLGAIWLGGTMHSGRGGGDGTVFFVTLFALASVAVTLESLFATSRIYRLERKERTLSSLATLPGALGETIKAKRRAVWISLVPGLFFVVISFIPALGTLLQGIAGPGFIWVAQGAGYLVAQLYFNHALVAWFSLRLKWGALPLALAISWIGNAFAMFVAALMFQFAAVFVLIIITVVATIAMQNAFRRRLEMAASED